VVEGFIGPTVAVWRPGSGGYQSAAILARACSAPRAEDFQLRSGEEMAQLRKLTNPRLVGDDRNTLDLLGEGNAKPEVGPDGRKLRAGEADLADFGSEWPLSGAPWPANVGSSIRYRTLHQGRCPCLHTVGVRQIRKLDSVPMRTSLGVAPSAYDSSPRMSPCQPTLTPAATPGIVQAWLSTLAVACVCCHRRDSSFVVVAE
jgi:hypothetical protein